MFIDLVDELLRYVKEIDENIVFFYYDFLEDLWIFGID